MTKSDRDEGREIGPSELADAMPVSSHKLTLRERLNYLRHLERLYDSKLGHWVRALHFVLVGSTGMVVDLLVSALLLQCLTLATARMELLVSARLLRCLILATARVVAIWVAMTWNFWLNRRLTFFDARPRAVLPQYLSFCLSCLLGMAISVSVSVGLCTAGAFFDRWWQLAFICGIVAGTGSNYLLSRRVVFQHDSDVSNHVMPPSPAKPESSLGYDHGPQDGPDSHG
ncbi:MAG: GtrA family protein [Planctomycetota bacterium]|nr:GtrA family protein [Planctomycetota bacterium]